MASETTGLQRTEFRDWVDRDEQQQTNQLSTWTKEKSQNQEDNAIQNLTSESEKITKVVNDLKSEIGMIKKHIFPKPTQGGKQNMSTESRAPFSCSSDHGT